jgi:transposase InsO family protein
VNAPRLAGSEIFAGERRVEARMLKKGDRVLRVIDSPGASFTVAKATPTTRWTGWPDVEIETTDRRLRVIAQTDVCIVEAIGWRGSP